LIFLVSLLDFGQGRCAIAKINETIGGPRRYLMAMQNERHNHWIQGNLDERLMVLAVIVLSLLSPFVVLFQWW
jgi:hypothetical protein